MERQMTLTDLSPIMRIDEDREGFIIRFDNGHMIKTKNVWYVNIHKTKELIASDRHILNLILENSMDDALPFLDEQDIAYVNEFEVNFRDSYARVLENLESVATKCINDAGGDRKKLAVEMLPASGLDKKNWGFVFKKADGIDIDASLDKFVRERLGNNSRYAEVVELLGLEVGRVVDS